MIKIFLTFLILLLIFFTAFIKNSTKRIDDEIFVVKENIRILKKDFEKNKLEYEYLSSAEKLLEFQNQFFDEKLVQKDIQEMKIIYNNLNLEELTLINESK